MMQSCSVPVVLDENPEGGFDYLATPSCERFRSIFMPDNEVIMHMQVACSTSILLRSTDEPIAKHLLSAAWTCAMHSCMHVVSLGLSKRSEFHAKLVGTMQSSDDTGNMPWSTVPITERTRY